MPRLPLPPQLLLLASAISALLFVLGYMVYVAVRIAWLHRRRKGDLRCPRCASGDVRHSHTSRWPDIVYLLGDCVPYRCRACQRRFYRPDDEQSVFPKPAREKQRKRSRGWRTLLVTVMFCVPVLVAVPVLYRFRTVALGREVRPEPGRDAALVLSEASFQGAGTARSIRGTVRNLSGKSYRNVQVVFQLSDTARQRIGHSLASIESVEPNATVPFRTGPVPEAAARMELRSIDGTGK
jgi:hypothetical protein